MPVVSFNDGHYVLQLIKHYTAHNCGAQELPWLRHFPVNEMPAPLMLTAASPQDVDDRRDGEHPKEGLMLCPSTPKSWSSWASTITCQPAGSAMPSI